MPTELPYAADAEVSLSYDELEVGYETYWPTFCFINECEGLMTSVSTGSSIAIPERIIPVAHHSSDEVQLCMGACEKSQTGTSS